MDSFDGRRAYQICSEGDRTGRSPGLTAWLTGLSGAGKSTIARAVHAELLARGFRSEILDADDLRKHLNRDLGFDKRDRDENVRRIAFIANLLTRNGIVVLVASISPYRAIREEARRLIGDFIEVHVHAPLSVCEARDPVGLYRKARSGQIHSFTGIDDPYEEPFRADVRCDTHMETLRESTDKVANAIMSLRTPMAKQHDAL